MKEISRRYGNVEEILTKQIIEQDEKLKKEIDDKSYERDFMASPFMKALNRKRPIIPSK